MTDASGDPRDLLTELEQLAQRQSALRDELAQIVDARTRLIAEARRRKIATWRQLALMFGMTEHGLIKADVAARGHRAGGSATQNH